MRFAALAAALTITSAAHGQPAAETDLRAYGKAAHALLVKDFLDPEGARLRNAFVSQWSPAAVALCGEVNGKNAYGAFIGYRRFIVVSRTAPDIEDPTLRNSFEGRWGTFCAAKLLELKSPDFSTQ